MSGLTFDLPMTTKRPKGLPLKSGSGTCLQLWRPQLLIRPETKGPYDFSQCAPHSQTHCHFWRQGMSCVSDLPITNSLPNLSPVISRVCWFIVVILSDRTAKVKENINKKITQEKFPSLGWIWFLRSVRLICPYCAPTFQQSVLEPNVSAVLWPPV